MRRLVTSRKFWIVLTGVVGLSLLLSPEGLVKAEDKTDQAAPADPSARANGIGYEGSKPVCVEDAENEEVVERYRAGGGHFHEIDGKQEAVECGLHPDEEFDLAVPRNVYLEIEPIGPFDFSITKPVVYLFIGTGVICLGALLLRSRLSLDPNKPQTAVEALYGFVKDQIVGSFMPEKAQRTWFPYIATLFFFIYVNNLIGFVPLPFGTEGDWGKNWSIYAAAANINVPFAFALVTFISTHLMGIRNNGVGGYFNSWAPHGFNPVVRVALGFVHGISEMARPVTLTVRLFANLLAGHLLIGILIGLIFVFGTPIVVPLFGGIALVVYLFEVILVCAVQAYIFAVLSAVYIGGAIEPEH
jgi:F-type H+-transporting ATPase subunit a